MPVIRDRSRKKNLRCTIHFPDADAPELVERNMLTGKLICPRCHREYIPTSSLQYHVKHSCPYRLERAKADMDGVETVSAEVCEPERSSESVLVPNDANTMIVHMCLRTGTPDLELLIREILQSDPSDRCISPVPSLLYPDDDSEGSDGSDGMSVEPEQHCEPPRAGTPAICSPEAATQAQASPTIVSSELDALLIASAEKPPPSSEQHDRPPSVIPASSVDSSLPTQLILPLATTHLPLLSAPTTILPLPSVPTAVLPSPRAFTTNFQSPELHTTALPISSSSATPLPTIAALPTSNSPENLLPIHSALSAPLPILSAPTTRPSTPSEPTTPPSAPSAPTAPLPTPSAPTTLITSLAQLPIQSFLAQLTPNLSHLVTAFEQFGCRTPGDLNVLCALGPAHAWLFFRTWFRRRYARDVWRWDVLSEGLSARAAALREGGHGDGLLSLLAADASGTGTASAVASLQTFLDGVAHTMLYRQAELLSKHGLQNAEGLDRICAVEEPERAWDALGESIMDAGLTGLEWLVLRYGLERRRGGYLASNATSLSSMSENSSYTVL